jgi:hypothetical protein
MHSITEIRAVAQRAFAAWRSLARATAKLGFRIPFPLSDKQQAEGKARHTGRRLLFRIQQKQIIVGPA